MEELWYAIYLIIYAKQPSCNKDVALFKMDSMMKGVKFKVGGEEIAG